jgi:hypothetical protein
MQSEFSSHFCCNASLLLPRLALLVAAKQLRRSREEENAKMQRKRKE